MSAVDPETNAVVGGGSIWIDEPGTCSAFRIDGSTGYVAGTLPLNGGWVVASDAGGAWRSSPTAALPYPTETPCTPGIDWPTQLDRIDIGGVVTASDVLPEATSILTVAGDEHATWVTYPRDARPPAPSAERKG